MLFRSKNPTEPFVKFFVSQVYEGRATSTIMLQFRETVKKSLNHLINDMITERLKSALDQNTQLQKKEVEQAEATIDLAEKESKIVTTQEELDGYYIVKSILRLRLNSERIIGRDTISYFGILLDDNNRKPICRLYFNSSKKQIGLFDEQKKETKYEISKLDDIYKFSDQLLKIVDYYEPQVK